MMGVLNVALVQTSLFWEDPKQNLLHFDKLLGEVNTDTDLVVLPEMFTTGFSMNTNLAQYMDGDSVQWMKNKAKSLNKYLAGSIIIKEDKNIYNRLLVVSPDGKLTYYDKRHLFSMANEDELFTAGNHQVVVDVHGVKINLMICYDLRFPVWSRNKRNGDTYSYDCLLYVANWPTVRSHVWRNLLQARAAENMAYVIGVNRVGEDKRGNNYDGDSMVIDPWGTILVESQKKQEEIVYSRIDMEVLKKARAKFPVADDADKFQLRL